MADVAPSASGQPRGGHRKKGKSQRSVAASVGISMSVGLPKGTSPNDLASFLHQLLAEERAKLTEFVREAHTSVESRFEAHLRDLLQRDDSMDCPSQASTETSPSSISKGMLASNYNQGDKEADLGQPFAAELPGEQVTKPLLLDNDETKTLHSDPRNYLAGQGGGKDEVAAVMGKAVSFGVNDGLVSKTIPFHLDETGKGSDSSDPKRSPSQSSKSAAKEKELRIRKSISQKAHASLGERILNSPLFEMAFAALIFFNALCMAFEQQYNGIETGYQLEYPGSIRTAKEAWPRAQTFFLVTENFFGVIFTLEVTVKAFVFRRRFFKSWWNLYDAMIILCWIVDQMSLFRIFMHPLLLRLARMGRLLRLLRFARTFQVFDVLHLLIRSMMACLSALMWSALFVTLVMMGTAIMMVYMLEEEFENERIPYEERLKLYKYFGTFTSGMFSMYELTMANWAPIARTVVHNVSEWYILFFMTYRTLVGFAILKVVTAIFNAETFRVTQLDDDIMLLHKERQIATHTRRMQQLLLEGDESDDGYLCLEEFKKLMGDKKVQRWLLAQDIELRDVELAFRILDKCGDGRISAEELVRGLAHLKGAARSTDMVAIVHAFSRVELLLDSISGALNISVPERVLQKSVSPAFHDAIDRVTE
eukprot:TRINITY_DN7781_c0_g6_i1.p1 TRINITY_DN7781_c0_g6~~TRINITY_DN7781_c0_g6_i1.p1  ORF type:complete len:650 (-),score=108.28 TRINITY_DN7781_c0_g6_i1:273-2222(-)